MDEREQAIGEIGRAMQRYQRSSRSMEDAVGRRFGLGAADLRCLDWLVDGPKTPGQLAGAIGLRPAATTAVIDRLERRGLVSRSRDSGDRRVITVRMTEEARLQANEVYRPIVDDETALLERLDSTELAQIRRWFDACIAITERRTRQLVAETAEGV